MDDRGAGAGTDSRDQPVPSRRCGSRLVAIPRASSPIIISGLSFVNPDRTSLDISAVQFLYCRLRSFIGGHLNETKPSRAISRSIDYDLGAVDFTCFGKRLLQVLISHSPGQVPDIQSATHYLLPGDLQTLRPRARQFTRSSSRTRNVFAVAQSAGKSQWHAPFESWCVYSTGIDLNTGTKCRVRLRLS